MSTKAKLIAFVSSFLLGVLVWDISPIVTGHTEPWDSSSAYYPLALLFGGIAVGLLQPGSVSIHYLGAFFGQLLFMLVATGAGPFIALGLGFLAAYSILLLIGAIAGSKVRALFQNKNFRGRDEA